MEYNSNNLLYGVQQGIIYGQNERVDELNERLYSRNIPDISLAPNFDPRPVPTKYALFPLINRRKESNVRINPMVNHNVDINFNPSNRVGPPQGYIVNVDVETMLRNQGIALQHGADDNVYVPSSNSDLYKVFVPSKPSVQPHPELFNKQTYQTYNANNVHKNIGNSRFFNHTRTQLRNI